MLHGATMASSTKAPRLQQERNAVTKQCDRNDRKRLTLIILAMVSLKPVIGMADTVNVSTAAELEAAVDGANSRGGDRTIVLADGRYTLNSGLYIDAPRVTLRSQSGDPQNVIIEGTEMGDSSSVGNVITVADDFFTLDGITVQNSKYHAIQIRGELDADSPVIRNCILRDANEQILKVSVDVNNTAISSDNGIVENCLFDYTAGIGPQWYIGGIDAHAADDWIVRGNTFKNIISPSRAVAEYAVHFWNGSSNTLVERNVIINCDRGIGFGLNERYNEAGIIRNNTIYHAPNLGDFSDVGISVHNSPDTEIYNNTVILEHDFPTSIEFRFDGSTGVTVTNNLTNRPIRSRDGGSGTIVNNVESAELGWFVDAQAGDLHLASMVAELVDQGRAVNGLADDLDGDLRIGRPDIGADEVNSTPRPNPPSGISVTQ